LQADLLTLAHQGTKAYSEVFDLVHRREAAGPNAIWQADHSPLDILLVRLTANRRSPGSRSSLITTAAPWLDISFLSSRLQRCGPHWRCAKESSEKMNPGGIFAGIPDVLYTDHGE
jgi:putative transposase